MPLPVRGFVPSDDEAWIALDTHRISSSARIFLAWTKQDLGPGLGRDESKALRQPWQHAAQHSSSAAEVPLVPQSPVQPYPNAPPAAFWAGQESSKAAKHI